MIYDIDILEDDILKLDIEVLERLLWDHSRPKFIVDGQERHHHIYWATDNYQDRGDGFNFFDEITIPTITGENVQVVRPRASKSKEEQELRTREKAEVFTPSWVCNAQNNMVDEAWFGKKNVFNEEYIEEGTHKWRPTEDKITFPEDKSWKDYVWDKRLEITCGEAPYIVSRYDTTTGEPIKELSMRIGLLDRKFRVIKENVSTIADWIYWAKCAIKSTYGFEWQGDNILLAREAIFFSFIEYYKDFCTNIVKKEQKLTLATLRTVAYIISWNIFQMDGMNFTLPMSGSKPKEISMMDLFVATEEETTSSSCTNSIEQEKIYAVVAEWKKDGEKNRVTCEFRRLCNIMYK